MTNPARTNTRKGFTLIELVIVIVVIGILAAIGIAKYVDIRTQALIAKEDAVIGALKTAIIADWLKDKSAGETYVYSENPFELLADPPPNEVVGSAPDTFDGVTWKIGLSEHEKYIYSPRGRQWVYAETWSEDMMAGLPPSIREY